jgi:hypothetical protein
MTSNRKTLSLRHPKDEPEADPAETVVAHGIEHLLCVRATRNREEIIIEPHILYTRQGERFVDAVVTDYRRDRDKELTTFKLGALRNPTITAEPFAPLIGFDPDAPRYAEAVIARVDG